MSLVQVNFEPSRRQLSQFGGICFVALPLLSWWWGATLATIASFAVLGLVVAALSFLMPKLIAPIFIGAMLISFPIGLVVSEIVILLVYIAVFLPIGLCFRLMRRDKLQLRLDRQRRTYWHPKEQPASVKNYYRQF